MLSWRMRNVTLNSLVFPAITLNRDGYYLRGLAGMLGNKVSKDKRSKIMENKVMVLLEIMRVNRHKFGTL